MIPTVARVNVPFRWSIADGLQGQSMIGRSYGREIAAVVSRPSRKWVFDRNGLLVPYNVGSVAVGVFSGETAALFEGANTNLCVRSEEFDHAAWSNNNTGVTVTPNVVAAPDGKLTGDLVAGDGTVTVQGKFQAPTFTGNGEKCISMFFKVGTGDTRVDFGLFDSTAAVFRHQVLLTWTNGVPAVTSIAGSGTVFTVQPAANGYSRVAISALGVIATNNNIIVFRTAAGTAAAGSVYPWGAEALNAAVPSSYNPAVASTVTRSVDSCYFDIPGLNPPRAMTVYVRGVERGTIVSASFTRLLHLGSGADPRLLLLRASTPHYRFANRSLAGAEVNSTLSTAPSIGDAVEIRATLSAAGSAQIHQSINAGPETSANASSNQALDSALSQSRLYINADQGGGSAGLFAFTHIVIADGVKTMAEMRELAGV